MVNINEYIEKSKQLQNISDGGSPAFSFDDKILVCYTVLSKYGEARKNEEQIMLAVNKKVDQGVNTPRHIAYKREIVGETSYCWVLQEKAPGECYSKYCRINDPIEQLKKQKEVAEIPDEHYEKYVADLMELYYFGIEPKSKNLFYDKEKGFTIIDLLKAGKEICFDKESLKDIMTLFPLTSEIQNCSINFSGNDISDELKQISLDMRYLIKFKIFNAIKKNIPNFDKYERFILRTFDLETLEKFKNYGVIIDDFTLNAAEEIIFDENMYKIALESIEKIKSGEYEINRIFGKIGNDLRRSGLNKSWMYHKGNTRKKIEKQPEEKNEHLYSGWDDWEQDESSDAYYEYMCEKDLEEKCFAIFLDLLRKENVIEENDYIKKALASLDNENQRHK